MTLVGPHLTNVSLAGAHMHTHIHTHTHTPLPGLFGCHEMRGALNGSGLPDGEPERPSRNRWAEDGGVLGMRAYREGKKGESIDSQGPPSLLPTPDYTYHHSPARPPPSHPTKFICSVVILSCNESAICTHMYGA